MSESWKPTDYPSLSPYLVCHDPEGTISFLQTVFHAHLLRRYDHQDGSLMHAEVRIDDSIIMSKLLCTQCITNGACAVFPKDVGMSEEEAGPIVRFLSAGVDVINPIAPSCKPFLCNEDFALSISLFQKVAKLGLF